MRRPLCGLLGALAFGLGVGAGIPTPADAQGVSVTFSTGANPGYLAAPARPVGIYQPGPPLYQPGPAYRHRRYERRAYYRPAPMPAPMPRRCVTRMERSWDGWGWVERPARFCR